MPWRKPYESRPRGPHPAPERKAESGLPGNRRLRQRRFHQAPRHLQAPDWNGEHVRRKAPDPFIANLIFPASVDQTIYRDLNNDIS